MENLSRTVFLYTIRLDTGADEAAACRDLLSADEIGRADRFVDENFARRWQVCRARLRQILASFCNVDPAGLGFIKQEFGKPVLAANQCDPELHFNLSHSNRLAVIAVTNSGPVGVDVEYIKAIRDWPGVASRFFSTHEQKQLASVAADQQQRAFYDCWTRKEAVIKATGEGLSASLDSFDVSLTPGAQPEVLADRRDNDKRWQMYRFEPEPGYVGAIAVHSSLAIEWRDPSCWHPGAD
jgi:4'-phosphopantetheinyl transferase